jgi:DNA-binding NtrC family response regulator
MDTWHALIVDIGLPDASGFDLVRSVSHDMRRKTLVVTGQAPSRRPVNEVQELGVELLYKPFSIDSIGTFLYRRALTDERLAGAAHRFALSERLCHARVRSLRRWCAASRPLHSISNLD